ncbi:MAG: amidohydrolase family protein [Thermoanaerobacteraceae bacterium]|nr:amidohydrolase family protein [Thermoanaerobacteraceae bacterium]
MPRYFCPRVVTGEGEERKNVILEIAGGLISELRWGVPLATAGEAVILPEGTTVLPGLIDCHIHLALDGVDFYRSLERWGAEEKWRPQLESQLQDILAAGIVAVRDGSDKAGIGLRAKGLSVLKPDIVACGQAIYREGRYGSFLGPGISDIDQVVEFLDRMAAAGIDQVKVVVSGIVSFCQYGKVGDPQFDRQFLTAVVREARSRGLAVMAHASGAEAVDMAVDAGVDSVEHGFFVREETLRKMAERGTVWVPTVIAAAGRLDCNRPEEKREVVERTVCQHLEAVSRAHDMGVTIAVGTDAGAPGVPHGKSFVREAGCLQQAGLSNKEVIRAATSLGARTLGLLDLGNIQPGKAASFIAVRGDPLRELAALKRVVLVYHRGRKVFNKLAEC